MHHSGDPEVDIIHSVPVLPIMLRKIHHVSKNGRQQTHGGTSVKY